MAKKHEPPSSSASDLVHATAKGAIGAIPVAGSILAEYFGAFFQSPVEKRRQAWMEKMASAMRELEEKAKLTADQLQNNEQFITTAMQAGQIAQRTHEEEKHEALRNALLNSVLPDAPDSSIQQMFLHWIDAFTTWHIRILKLFDNPTRWFTERQRQPPAAYVAGGLPQVLEAAYPEMKGKRDFYDLIWKELYSAGLHTTPSFHGVMSGSGMLAERTTEMGKKFISFITDRYQSPR